MNAANLHWLDITIFSVIGVGLLWGLLTGFFRQMLRLTSLVLAFYGALGCHEWTGRTFSVLMADLVPSARRPVAFGITFFAFYLLLWLAFWLLQVSARNLLPKDRPSLGLGWLNRLLGAGVGAVLACVAVGGAVLALDGVQDAKFQAELQGSVCRPSFLRGTETVLARIPHRYRLDLIQALEQAKEDGLEALGELSATSTREATSILRPLEIK